MVLVLIAFGVAALSLYYSTRVAGQPLTPEGLMKQLFVLPILIIVAAVALGVAFMKSRAPKAASTEAVPAAVAAPAQNMPFRAQVVGLAWLNPLQRRDYPPR
ncbi:hypothetical protein [Burkholderia arboris]|nr:hypothetical protein [Burkholderia arboris]